MKILIVHHQNFINGSGGTEKVCTFLANGFSDSGHTVEIATNQNVKGKPVFVLNQAVKVTNIFNENIRQIKLEPTFNYSGFNPFYWIFYKIKKKKIKIENKKLLRRNRGIDGIYIKNLRQRALAWKSYIDALEPDVIITMTIHSLLEITYENDYNIPILNSTNGRPDYDYTDILWYRSPVEMILLKKAYEKLAGIQILFDSYKNFVPRTFVGVCEVIPNPIPQFAENELVHHRISKRKYKITNVASLITDCKQQHLAIDAFAEISEKFPNWELHFWGEGSDFQFLNNKIKQLNLEHRIFLNGFTDDPLSELKDSDIFIFPSKYEGFGLALAEAMAVGLPCLGLISCSGVNELINNNKSGYLVKEDELSQYLEKLIESSDLRAALGKNAYSEMKKFNPEEVLRKWNRFLEKIVN